VVYLPPSAARAIKNVIASARPHHHPGLEPGAVDSFADLWVADAHWEAAATISTKPAAPTPAG